MFDSSPSLLKRVFMHFIVPKFVVELSLLKLLDMILSLFIISEIESIFVFVWHSHIAFFDSELYLFKVQLLSHMDKLLSVYSLCLSFNIISVPSSVVYEKHSSV
jgi:hypothetical protein